MFILAIKGWFGKLEWGQKAVSSARNACSRISSRTSGE